MWSLISRTDSSTFLGWFGLELTADNRKMVVIPEGCAHGFQALQDNTEIVYPTTEFYAPESEKGVRFDDPLISISWPMAVTEVSEKDRRHPFIVDKKEDSRFLNGRESKW